MAQQCECFLSFDLTSPPTLSPLKAFSYQGNKLSPIFTHPPLRYQRSVTSSIPTTMTPAGRTSFIITNTSDIHATPEHGITPE
jgi:hypothetical protein